MKLTPGIPALPLLALLLFQAWLSKALALPNVVIIVTDDQGWADVGYHTAPGQVPIQTPVMDSFAATGIRLERFYATAVCSVTRSCLLTGRNTLRTGTNNTRGVPLAEHLMPQSFKAAGYQTFMCGKWHLGGSDKNLSYTTVNGRQVRIIQEGLEYAPCNRGWDSHYGQYSGAIDYFTHRSAEADNPDIPDWWLNGVQQDGASEHTDSQGHGGWSPDLLADKAVSHIQNRDPAKPMLLYLAFNSIHGPVSAPPALLSKYSGITNTARRTIAAAVDGMDAAMGRVLAALDNAGISNNTLVVWFGDNGGDETKGSLNDPLRGTKGDGYDGAIHEVAGIRWPGVLPAGVISHQYVWAGDLFPTICAATGVAPLNRKPFDGLNLWPGLLSASNSTVVARPSPLVTATAIPSAFHTFTDPVNGGSKVFKLIRNRAGTTTVNELFNMTDDPYETTDLLLGANAAGYSGIVSTLTAAITSITPETPLPYIGPPLITNSVTQGSTITLYAPFTSYRPPTVQWRKGGSPVAGGTFTQVSDPLGDLVTGAYTTTLTLTGVTAANAGSYDVVVTNATGSTTSEAGTLSVTVAVAPTIAGVYTAPTAPTYLDVVTVLAQVAPAPGRSLGLVQLSYETGVPVSRTVFRETFNYTSTNPWNGSGSLNPWSVTAVTAAHLRQAVGTSNRTVPIALTSCETNGTAAVSCASTAGLWPGMRITGSGIPAGTTVLRVNSSTSFDLSAAASGSGSGLSLTAAGMTLTNAATNSTSTIVCNSTVGLATGMAVTGPGLANNSTVSTINPNNTSFVLNTAATATNTGLTLSASGAAAEFQTGTANPADTMFRTTNPIDCTGTAGYAEFYVQTRDMASANGDQWTFQISTDGGSVWNTRLAETSGANHGFQLYHYDLTGAELGADTRLRFQFAGHTAVAPARPPRVDIDDIVVAVTSLPSVRNLPMFDDGLHGDGAAGDGIYAAQIPVQPGGTSVSYRITATGSDGASTASPATSSFSYGVNAALTDSVITNAEFLGIPTDTGITLNVAAAVDLEAYVEYGTVPFTYLSATAPALYPAGNGAIEIPLMGLQRNTQYFYRLRYRMPGTPFFNARGGRSFRTARPRGVPFVFTVTADPHLDVNTDPTLLARTMQNIAADQPDLHIDLGDIFMTDKMADGTQILPAYGGGVLPTEARVKTRASLFRTFFEQACHSTPYFYVLGNHEAEYGYLFTAAADKQNNIPAWNLKARKLYYPTPVPSGFYSGNPAPLDYPGGTLGLLENYYAWEWGDALFIVLDPFWNTMANPNQSDDAWQWSLGRTQYDWLKTTLQNSSAAYKFVFMHHLTGGSTTLADGTTKNIAARGGIEVAGKYEWGGKNADGITDGFATRRPGWGLPVHQLLVQNKVNIVFHGHDHLYAYQTLGGVTYVECPQPGTANYTTLGSAGDGKYTQGLLLPNSGHIRISISPAQARTEYVRAYRPQDESAARQNREVSHRFTMAPRVFPPIEMYPPVSGQRAFRWNAVPGKPYAVQWTPDPSHWSTIDTVTFPAVSTNGSYTDTNPARVNQPRSFYRVSYTP